MNEQEMLSHFVVPSMERPDRWNGGILQIHVTRACSEGCVHCTQGSNLRGKPVLMSLAQFESACKSLATYPHTVGVFGGQPTLHPQFEQICDILCQYVPFERRGLWSNAANGHGPTCRRVFNPRCSNINVHTRKHEWDEWLRDWPDLAACIGPNLKGLDSDSRHGAPFVAMRDVGLSQEEINERAANCEVQRFWSSLIGVTRGKVMGYVCELMYAQAAIHENDPDWPETGFPVDQMYDGKYWWQLSAEAFAEQIRFHCCRCGMPLKSKGQLAIGGTLEQVSVTHAPWYRPKDRNRPVQLVTSMAELEADTLPSAIEYIQNGSLPILN